MTNGKVSVRDSRPTYSMPYLIREGDNLTKISKATRISIERLVKENNIKDPNLIYKGDTLNLNIYGYSIQDISTSPISKTPDFFRNTGLNSLRKEYIDINNKGVSLWLQENSK